MFNLASLPAVALASANSQPAKIDTDAFCALVERWPEAQRFPRKDLPTPGRSVR